MSIRIILYDLNKDDEAVHESRKVYFWENDQLLIGSNKNCDLVLTNVPDLAVLIYKHNDDSYQLEKKEKDTSLKINGVETQSKSVRLKNGDKIQINDYSVHFIIEFSKAGHNWNSGFIAFLSTFLIVAILIVEFGIITWLPREIRVKQLWGLEVTRQRTLDSMDGLRLRCESSVKTMEPGLDKNTLKLIIDELDDISIYLRDYVSKLDAGQLTEINKDLSIYSDRVNRLEQGLLFPPEERIDPQYFFKEIIEK